MANDGLHITRRAGRVTCTSMIAAGLLAVGCPFVPLAPEPIPDSILAACPGFTEENIRGSMTAVRRDADAGVPRAESFDQFELGCVATCDTINCVADCLDCGQAIYDVIYGP